MLSVDLKSIWDAARPWIVAFIPDPDKLPGLLASGLEFSIKAAALYAFLLTLRRLPQIKEMLTAFIEARGRIWDLRNTVDELKRLEPVIKAMGDRLERLAETVDVIRAQNIEAQLESSAERTDEPPEVEQPAAAPRARVREDVNWAKLRRLYLRNVRRLQRRVESIDDGRTYNSYARIGWKRPKLMVEKLEQDRLISERVATASLKQIDQFNLYKPRHTAVPDEVVGAMEVLDGQLEEELGPAPSDEEL